MPKARRRDTQQELLSATVRSLGSEALVAKKLGCSQQSVSAWRRGSWLPRRNMQNKMLKVYGIPMPWTLPPKDA